ncbi:hypothetical protein N5P37_004324 [Trichoderma harzianum]|nr:hypothetical protein N5P37_004324 [Trichoderma harzianum]
MVPPERVFSCYCLDCAKNSGGPYQLVAKYDVSKITVKDPQNAQAVWIISRTQSGFEKHSLLSPMWLYPVDYTNASSRFEDNGTNFVGQWRA